MKFIKHLYISVLLLIGNMHSTLNAQDKVILDEVIAVIGNEVTTKYEFENQYNGLIGQGMPVRNNTRCLVLEDIFATKLLLNQSKIDSVAVSDAQVESEMDRRLRYYIAQVGSEQRLEQIQGKSMAQIKDDLRESLREQMLVQSIRGNIAADVQATPEEVRNYFNALPKDSLPLVSSEVEVAHIVINAPMSDASLEDVKSKLREFKNRVQEGEKFSTLAVLYSEDNGSAVKGGEIGFVGKAEVEPEYAAAAFQLKEGQVSPIVKTRYGYHIIQLIERRANKVNTRHILLKPKNDPASMEKAKLKLDSIVQRIENKELSFTEAALKYSDDDETKKNGGIIINPATSSSLTPMEEIDPSIFFVIDKMAEGDLSEPVAMQGQIADPGYHIIRLNKRTEPHKASLELDYQRIKNAAMAEKEEKVLEKWIASTLEDTYVKLNEDYTEGCKFQQDWTKNK